MIRFVSLVKFKIAIFISGRGSNMESIIKYIQDQHRHCRLSHVEIKIVISDQPGAHGLKVAQKLGIKAIYLNPGKYQTKLEGEGERRYLQYLEREEVNFICLAGFMRVLKSKMINRFPFRIINIHPSLLPDYPGLNTHQRVLDDGKKMTGCTLHFVDEGIDTGKILVQKKVQVDPESDVRSLGRKVIEKEHEAYKEGLEKIFSRQI